MAMSDNLDNRDRGLPRRMRRGAILGAGLLVLAVASAVLSANALGPVVAPAPATGVAVGDDAPLLFPAPAVAHSLPMPIATAAETAGLPVSAAGGCINVPIVYYHYIRVNPNPRDRLGAQLSVAPANFQAQMDWLQQAGGHTVTLAQVMRAMGGGPPLPSHPVVLTFDDGHDDFATRAVPILLRDHFVATAFVVPGFLGRTAYMTGAQVRQVAAEGMVIGAHTVHHTNLTKLSPLLAAIEISSSRALLQQLIGAPVLDFAYPYGGYDQTVVNLVAQAGFRDAVATTWGTLQCGANRFALHRLEILGQSNLAFFSAAVGVPAPPPRWVDPAAPSAGASPSPAPSPSPTGHTA